MQDHGRVCECLSDQTRCEVVDSSFLAPTLLARCWRQSGKRAPSRKGLSIAMAQECSNEA